MAVNTGERVPIDRTVNIESKLVETVVESVNADKLKSRLEEITGKRADELAIANRESESVGGYISTVPMTPRIVYEDGANPCTLMLVMDTSGCMAVSHEPMVGNLEARGELSEISVTVIEKADEILAVDTRNQQLIVSGLNVDSEMRTKVLDAMASHIYNGDRVVLALSDDPEVINYGLVGIPKQMTADGKNHVLVLGRYVNQNPVDCGSFAKKNTGIGFKFNF